MKLVGMELNAEMSQRLQPSNGSAKSRCSLPPRPKSLLDGRDCCHFPTDCLPETISNLGEPNRLSFGFLLPTFVSWPLHSARYRVAALPSFARASADRNEETFVFLSAGMTPKLSSQRPSKQTSPPCCVARCRDAARTWKAVRYIGSSSAKTHKYRWRPRQGKHFDS